MTWNWESIYYTATIIHLLYYHCIVLLLSNTQLDGTKNTDLWTDIMQFCNLTSLFLDVQTFQMWNYASQLECVYCTIVVVWSKLYLYTIYIIIFTHKWCQITGCKVEKKWVIKMRINHYYLLFIIKQYYSVHILHNVWYKEQWYFIVTPTPGLVWTCWSIYRMGIMGLCQRLDTGCIAQILIPIYSVINRI